MVENAPPPASSPPPAALMAAARRALEARRLDEARGLLLQVLDQDENNAMAWLWLSGAVRSAAERRICLENVLALEPDHALARRGLARLDAVTGPGAGQRPDGGDSAFEPPASAGRRRPPMTPAGAILYPPDPAPAPDPSEPETNRPEAMVHRVEPVATAAASQYDDVWSRDDEICPYCARALEPEATRCPACGRRLTGRFLTYDQPSTGFWFYLVCLLGTAQFALIDILLGFLSGRPAQALLTLGLQGGLLFLLAWPVYRRQAWAHLASLLLFLYLLVERLFFSPLGLSVPGLLQVVGSALGLVLALFVVWPDFARSTARLSARVTPGRLDGDAYFALGRRYAQQGQWARAVRHWQRAVALAPANLRYQQQLGQAYARLGFYQRSLDILFHARRRATTPEARARCDALIAQVEARARVAPDPASATG